MEKIYTILKHHDRRGEKRITGTLAELNTHFNENAKSITSLINKLRKRYLEREAACYDRTSFQLLKENHAH
jgi:hypothetical protein